MGSHSTRSRMEHEEWGVGGEEMLDISPTERLSG